MSGCRPAVSNETIVATRQEFFFTKLAPMQSITDIVLLDFWLMLLPWMFILSYTTIYFFLNKFIFSNVYISVNRIFECRSRLSMLIFTHTVSCWSRSYEVVKHEIVTRNWTDELKWGNFMSVYLSFRWLNDFWSRRFKLATREFELVSFQLVTSNS